MQNRECVLAIKGTEAADAAQEGMRWAMASC